MERPVKEIVERLVKNFNATVGVGFKDLKGKDLKGEEEFYYNGDKRFLTASVFKVFVIVELYNQVMNKEVNLDERYTLEDRDKVIGSGILQEMQEELKPTIRDLTKLMMILSDNTATDRIMDILGKERINETVRTLLGLERTGAWLTTREILLDAAGTQDMETARKNFEEMKIDKTGRWAVDLEHNDVTTPKEMIKTLESLYRKKILTPQLCEEILTIMKACQTGEARIRRFLPENVKVAHKTGTMPGIVNDAGIVFTPRKDYILVIFINELEYENQPYVAIGEDLIAEISREIYVRY